MSLRQSVKGFATLRIAAAVFVAILLSPSLASAQSAFLPKDFFDKIPKENPDASMVEADTLAYDGDTKTVSADGSVVLHSNGMVLTGDHLIYHQKGGAMTLTGHVTILDADGNKYNADSLDLTGGMKNAVLKSMTLTMPSGTQITADNTQYASALETVLDNATYSPCGDCIDAKGHRIGWQVKGVKFTYNAQTKMVYIEQPHLELLGIPIAWAPFLSFPDPTQEHASGFRTPSVSYSQENGAGLWVPYYMALDQDTDLLLTPGLFSRQGILLGAQWTHRFTGGSMTIEASGIHQMHPEAYGTQVGNREWRGAIQTSGHFTPMKTWTAGWSYTEFTDPGYLLDYDFQTATTNINQVYATHLGPDDYADIRVQKFRYLDTDPTETSESRQALLVPNARYDSVLTLDGGLSQVGLTARLIGLHRDDDDSDVGAVFGRTRVPYIYGYKGTKAHAMVQADWQRQWIGPGGLVTTPYLGLRGDAAYYDGASTIGDPTDSIFPQDPDAQNLFSLTPIAAVDVRWPLLATAGTTTHIIEPIAQLVYRGTNVSEPGITNDDAQSFVFDDTNLFSYNRFSGTDRQETGLRANVGVRYQADFGSNTWLELLAGESFHIAGTNGLGIVDAAQVGAYSGLGDTASYVVLGAKGSLNGVVNAAAKAQIDPYSGDVVRAGFNGGISQGGYGLNLEYIYLAPNAALGVPDAQHEAGAVASAPLPFDYWRATAGLYWDLRTNQWLGLQGGVSYDDGFLALAANISTTGPTAETPNDVRFLFSFKLKGPEGEVFGQQFSYASDTD
ncbi:MAG TPA: LPS assembly protein LptD [Devosiaceae bacterium]|jgi:LPS-assembly protein